MKFQSIKTKDYTYPIISLKRIWDSSESSRHGKYQPSQECLFKSKENGAALGYWGFNRGNIVGIEYVNRQGEQNQ